MKTRILYTALAAFAVSSISASAQEGDRPKREIPPEVIAKFDKDGDGKLNEDERKAAGEARKAQMAERRAEWEAMTDEEKEAKKAEMKAKHEALLAKYDADKNGKLSPEERKAAVDAGEKLPPHRPQGARGPEGKGGAEGKGGPEGRRGPGGPGGKGRPGGKGAPAQ